MKKAIISILILSLVVLVGCSSTDFDSCMFHCRSNKYMGEDFNCGFVESDIVKEKCGFNESFILSAKNDCFNECKGVQ